VRIPISSAPCRISGGRRLRIHVPFALPVGADEGGDDLVDEITAALPHQALFFGETADWGDVEHDDFPDRSSLRWLGGPQSSGAHRCKPLPLAGRGWGGGIQVESPPNDVHHSLAISKHVVVPEPQDLEAIAVQVSIALFIGSATLFHVVLSPIDFDDHPR
jgi:hypothetical protein